MAELISVFQAILAILTLSGVAWLIGDLIIFGKGLILRVIMRGEIVILLATVCSNCTFQIAGKLILDLAIIY
jgi:hypothetical protein